MVFHVNPPLNRGFTLNIMPYFLQKMKVKNDIVFGAFLLGPLMVETSDCLLVTQFLQIDSKYSKLASLMARYLILWLNKLYCSTCQTELDFFLF